MSESSAKRSNNRQLLEKVTFSNKSQIVLGTNNHVYIWWKEDEKYNPHNEFDDLEIYLCW